MTTTWSPKLAQDEIAGIVASQGTNPPILRLQTQFRAQSRTKKKMRRRGFYSIENQDSKNSPLRWKVFNEQVARITPVGFVRVAKIICSLSINFGTRDLRLGCRGDG